MKIYKCIALVTLILGLALCVGGVLMNGLDQLPGEAQKVTNYVKFKSFGKAKDVNQVNEDARFNCTITEMIYVNNTIQDGSYLLNLQFASFENDASPSKPVLYKIEK